MERLPERFNTWLQFYDHIKTQHRIDIRNNDIEIRYMLKPILAGEYGEEYMNDDVNFLVIKLGKVKANIIDEMEKKVKRPNSDEFHYIQHVFYSTNPNIEHCSSIVNFIEYFIEKR